MDFLDKLRLAQKTSNSLVCVGLDTDKEKIPAHLLDGPDPVFSFNKAIVDATYDLVSSYKLQYAFYGADGITGIESLLKTVAYIHEKYPKIPVILDAKRGDIGNTAEKYAQEVFEVIGADAVTVNPYLGFDSLEPFLERKDKGIIILCRTSNTGASDFQDLKIDGKPLYLLVAQKIVLWNEKYGNCLMVVGATWPEQLKKIRNMAPDMTFLIPGIGAQGGELEATIRAGINKNDEGMIIHSARGIIYAAEGLDFAKAAREETLKLRKEINRIINLRKKEDLILQLHKIGAVKFGQFTLKSGMTSPIYIDLRVLVSYPSVLGQVAEIYAHEIEGLNFDRFAAVPYAAIPIATALALQTGKPMIYTRKEVKDHGIVRPAEGEYQKGDECLVIEDLVTTGGSILETIDSLKAAEIKVGNVAFLLDREQGGVQNLEKKGLKVHYALRINQVLDVLNSAGKITPKQYKETKKYINANKTS